LARVLRVVLDDLQKSGMKMSSKWKAELDNYLRVMPGYYASVSLGCREYFLDKAIYLRLILVQKPNA